MLLYDANTARLAPNPFDQSKHELAAGLLAAQAYIPPKYFYNCLGSKLFEAICALEEYYPTSCEAQIFARFGSEIAARAGEGTTLIDLGAGNCQKAAALFGVLKPGQYVPIDISAQFLHKAVSALTINNPGLPIHPLAFDFSQGLPLPPEVRQDHRLFFYPGSSLGNFNPPQALQFLRRLHGACPGGQGALIIGIDLLKDRTRLKAAYDDALGVTAAFNRNVLLHVNELLGTDFDLRDWRHSAVFNVNQGRIEMHLVARRTITVQWPQGKRQFVAGNTIHTENSYKYTKTSFCELLRAAGFGDVTWWTDTNHSFLVCHAEAR